jgi:hypothetical protein
MFQAVSENTGSGKPHTSPCWAAWAVSARVHDKRDERTQTLLLAVYHCRVDHVNHQLRVSGHSGREMIDVSLVVGSMATTIGVPSQSAVSIAVPVTTIARHPVL